MVLKLIIELVLFSSCIFFVVNIVIARPLFKLLSRKTALGYLVKMIWYLCTYSRKLMDETCI